MLKVPGPTVALTQGAGSFVPGNVRFPFMVITNDARPVNRPTARVWIASGRDQKPFAQTTARLERIGISGISEPAAGGVTRIYVTHLRIARPGRYWLVTQPAGRTIKGVGVFDVRATLPVPKVGAEAPPSRTPTLAGAPAAALTTARPPDRSLLRYSVAASLAAHKPFVVTFATPKYCTSRVCGPVVDIVRTLIPTYGDRVAFIHQEVWQRGASQEFAPTMVEWNLRSEPWIFVVDGQGMIRASFEGLTTRREVEAALRSMLGRP